MSLLISMEQLQAATAVIMRVPGLFIIDYWWQYERNKSFPNSVSLTDIFNAIATNIVLLHGFLLLLLPLPHVKALYTHFVSGCLIATSHMMSWHYVSTEKKLHHSLGYYFVAADRKVSLITDFLGNMNFLWRQAIVVAFHVFSTMAVSCLLSREWKPCTVVIGCYALPVLARLVGLPLDSLEVLHNFACAAVAVSVFFYVSHQMPNILDFLKLSYVNVVVTASDDGVMAVLSLLWNKLSVPHHFAVFWLVEFFTKLFCIVYQDTDRFRVWGHEWYIIVLSTVSSICASPTSLVATAVSVSYLSFFVLSSTRAFLLWELNFNLENPLHSGWTEGLTLIILAFQAGLSEVKIPDRVGITVGILFIVLASLLQSMLEVAEPVVLALSASGNRNVGRHIRALGLGVILLTFPLYLTRLISQLFPIDFWMMIVLSSCVLTSFHVIDLLVIHALFMYDSVRPDPWENLDDIIYYARAVTKVLEFIVSVIVVGMGLWESITSRWNHMCALILIVHCYFNVWQRLRSGWRSFLLRREAAKKSESLPAATEEQLKMLDDVCAICFMSMKTACRTPCHHYFHRTCLRKWLYVQEDCPLCHTRISVQPRPPVAEALGIRQEPHEHVD